VALEEHRTLWGQSLSASGSTVARNHAQLEQQHRELHKMLAVLNPFISRYALSRTAGAYGQPFDIFLTAVSDDIPLRKGRSMREALPLIDGIVALLEVEKPDVDISQTPGRPAGIQRIFISHGTESSALLKVERFVRALGHEPVIVKHQPSLGGSVDDVVESNMTSCAAAIVVATRDEQVEGRYQPRPNVLHEIGMAQQKLNNRVIYLKERGCDFPSNINPKIWETFTNENMEEAFIKIAKELHGFELI
jgi:hypothetical protein